MPKRSSTDRPAAQPKKRSVKEAVALLGRADFRAAVDEYHRVAIRLRGLADREEQTAALLGGFRERWGVEPPLDAVIGGGEQAQRSGEILSGRWAVIPVFRSTRLQDVMRAWRRFDQGNTRQQPKVARARRDRAIAAWLQRSGYTHYEIACGHYTPGATPGLSRARTWRRAEPEPADRQRTVDKVRDDIERYERDFAQGVWDRHIRRPSSDPRAAALTRLFQAWAVPSPNPSPPGTLNVLPLLEAVEAVVDAFVKDQKPGA
jgi:hypothetical protein